MPPLLSDLIAAAAFHSHKDKYHLDPRLTAARDKAGKIQNKWPRTHPQAPGKEEGRPKRRDQGRKPNAFANNDLLFLKSNTREGQGALAKPPEIRHTGDSDLKACQDS